MVQDHTWTERSQIRSSNVTHMHERTIRVDTEEDIVPVFERWCSSVGVRVLLFENVQVSCRSMA